MMHHDMPANGKAQSLACLVILDVFDGKGVENKCRSCSMALSGEILGSFDDFIGMNIAKSTPANVACTPDFRIATHIITPTTTYKLVSETPRLLR
jgi:hypothetical protein